MVEHNQRDRWQHTAHLMCLVANCHRNEKERSSPFEAWEFNPFELRDRDPVQQRISWSTFERLLGVDDDAE